MWNTTPPRKRQTKRGLIFEKCQQVTGTENSLWTSSIQPPKTSWNKSINIIDSGASSVLQRWRDDKLFPIKWSLSLWPQCESRLDSIKDSFKSKPLSFISDLHWMSGRLFFFCFLGTFPRHWWRERGGEYFLRKPFIGSTEESRINDVSIPDDT